MEITIREKTTHYFDSGKSAVSKHPCWVFVHGAAGQNSIWEQQIRELSWRGHRVVALDLPGHGKSAGPALGRIEELALWLIDFLDAVDIFRPILVGHSLGSLVVLEATARQPERVEGLALVGSAFPMRVSEALLRVAREAPERAFEMMNDWFFAPQSYLGKNALPGYYLPGLNLAMERRSNPAALAIDLAACNDYANGLAAAAAITCPTLLLCGEEDRMTPPAACASLADAIAHRRTIRIRHAGHALMLEQPLAVTEALLETTML